MTRCTTLFVTLLLGFAGTAETRAQTTRPAPSRGAPVTWSSAVEAFANAVTKGDPSALAGMLAHDAAVRSFDTGERVAPPAMARAVSEWTLLGAHGYEFPPPALAKDIAADVSASDMVADRDKARITPPDDAELARANATAADWVAQTLGAERNHLVGVAVFWNAKLNRPMFVLVKGQPTADSFEVKLAVYGDPMARKPAAGAAATAR